MIGRKGICWCLMSIVLGVPLAACDSGAVAPAPSAVPSATAAAVLTSPTASGGTAAATSPPNATIPAPAIYTAAAATSVPTSPPAVASAPTIPATPATTEQPLAPEQNPVGDIPDSQVFVQYRSADGGYELSVPEGWGRSGSGTGVRFVDKLDGVEVQITAATSAPTAATARAHEIAALIQAGRAVQVGQV